MTRNDILRHAFAFHHVPVSWETFIGGMMKLQAVEEGYSAALPVAAIKCPEDRTTTKKGQIYAILADNEGEMRRDVFLAKAQEIGISANTFKNAVGGLVRDRALQYRFDGRNSWYRVAS